MGKQPSGGKGYGLWGRPGLLCADPGLPVRRLLTLKSVDGRNRFEVVVAVAGWKEDMLLSGMEPGSMVLGAPTGDGGPLHDITSPCSNLIELGLLKFKLNEGDADDDVSLDPFPHRPFNTKFLPRANSKFHAFASTTHTR